MGNHTPLPVFQSWLGKLREGLRSPEGGCFLFLHLAIQVGINEGQTTLDELHVSQQEWDGFPRAVVVAAGRALVARLRQATFNGRQELEDIQVLVDLQIPLEEFGLTTEGWLQILDR